MAKGTKDRRKLAFYKQRRKSVRGITDETLLKMWTKKLADEAAIEAAKKAEEEAKKKAEEEAKKAKEESERMAKVKKAAEEEAKKKAEEEIATNQTSSVEK